MCLRNNRGQSTLEYALLIAVVVGALIVVQTYMKKSVQGRLKSSADQVGQQFDPTKYEISYKVTSSGTTKSIESRDAAGSTTSNIDTSETLNRSEYETFVTTSEGTAPDLHYQTGAGDPNK